MKEPKIKPSTAPLNVFLLGISLAVACLTGVASLAGCDTGGVSIPEITVFAPGSSLPVDTLIIGEPFGVMAEVSSRTLEAVEIEVAYGQFADPILSVRIDRFAGTTPLVIDTTLVLPSTAQPSDIAGQPATFSITAYSDGGTLGDNFFVYLADPTP